MLGLVDFIFATGKRFVLDGCFRTAGSLTFTTLLSLVPLITVLFGVLSLFPAFRDMTSDLRHLLVSQLVPTSGELVQHYLVQFSEKASRLTLVGSLWLLVTAVLTLSTVDMALNAIWRTRRHRDTLVVFIVYWTLLTLGPLLFGTGFAVTSYVFAKYRALMGTSPDDDWLALHALSLFLETLTFTLLFVLVPRTRVSLKHALVGGVFTALLFEASKRGFSFYVSHFKNYELIYGAFSAVPIFLIWIYLSWLIVLLGAEVTACLTLDCHRARMDDETARRSLRLAVRLIARLGEGQRQGRGVGLHQLATGEPVFTQPQVETMLEHLADLKIARQVGADWLLVRDLQALNLYEFYTRGDFSLRPSGPHGKDCEALDERMDVLLAEAESGLKPALDISLGALLAAQSAAGGDTTRPSVREGDA
ncbi:hypothetical protein BJI67_11050 [Acidihalobacter aeolianus]|uniref:UPF0761 membrane protein BJI67_11050 n=1 Tax=Acidihalobacter aeolianus TaxID=2792603 RepID=A0A1D8K977_9GAMM|nr:YihY family inner membrane protein [Acidihalobacter aeolianus]AOV17528.1 hypothetical protein BJI67_11050 [Acidihalobacter aeolianus]